jgi:hypothetical protein
VRRFDSHWTIHGVPVVNRSLSPQLWHSAGRLRILASRWSAVWQRCHICGGGSTACWCVSQEPPERRSGGVAERRLCSAYTWKRNIIPPLKDAIDQAERAYKGARQPFFKSLKPIVDPPPHVCAILRRGPTCSALPPSLNRAAGSPLLSYQAVLKASLEVRSAVVYASLIVILVFLPVVFLGGLSGAFFQPLALRRLPIHTAHGSGRLHSSIRAGWRCCRSVPYWWCFIVRVIGRFRYRDRHCSPQRHHVDQSLQHCRTSSCCRRCVPPSAGGKWMQAVFRVNPRPKGIHSHCVLDMIRRISMVAQGNQRNYRIGSCRRSMPR